MIKKKLNKVLVLFLMMFMALLPVAANEEADEISNTGSITITLTDTKDDLPKENVTFGVKKIANVVDGEYVLVEEFEESEIDLNKLSTANELKEASTAFEEMVTEADLIQMTDRNGVTTFTDLGVGVYLIYPIDIADYEIIEPFIVAIPTWNEADGVMDYDVSVYPKHTDLPVIQVNKVDSYTKKAIISKDFEFTAYADKNCKNKAMSVHANTEDGTASFVLTYGEWWIKETKAPTGYLLSEEVKHVEINKEGVYIDGKKVESSNNIYSFVYENQLLPSIRTGDEINIDHYLGLFVLSGVSVLIMFKFSRKAKYR